MLLVELTQTFLSRAWWPNTHEFADDVVGLSRFGASAPAPVLYQQLGITAEAVAARVAELLGKE
jgi:transketolase